jgi:hypothetical protein
VSRRVQPIMIVARRIDQLLPRWLPTVVVERDGDFSIDQHRFDPTTGRALTERVIVRDGRVRRFAFSVRMFVAAELGDWLRGAGFASVEFYDGEGDPLTHQGRRMITIACR